MSSIAIENLPADHTQISSEPIRNAAAAYSAAKAELNERKKDVVELENTRPSAEWAQAEQIEQAAHDGKPAPKRDLLAEHDKKLDPARMAEKVATLALERRHRELVDALGPHGDEWVAQVTDHADALLADFHAKVNELFPLHAELSAALSTLRATGSTQPGLATIPINAGQDVPDLELAQRANPKAAMHVAAVLAKLSDLGKPAPAPESREPVQPIRIAGPAQSHGGAQAEIEERRRFDERVAAEQAAEQQAA